MSKKRKVIIALSIVPAILLVKLLTYFPYFVEAYYSEGLYIWISKLSRYAFGWIPFSVGDIFYTIASILIIRWLVLSRKRIINDTLNWTLEVLATMTFVYIAFHIFWGLNYYRLPLHEKLELDYTYSTEELIETTKKLIEQTNTIHLQITGDDSIKVSVPYSKTALISISNSGFKNLNQIDASLDFRPQSSKRSLYSVPLTYMGFSGYLNPFTNEAQIDGIIPLYQYPFTVCHEQAHQLGYAAENEANFISFLATSLSEDKYVQYSGYAASLRYCLNELFRRDEEMFKSLRDNVHKGVLKNYKESFDFWENYKNPLEPLFKNFYSNFLKVNNQDKGIESYSYVVALIVNYYEQTDEL